MTRIRTIILTMTGLLVTASLPALASTPLAEKADTNKDGLISQAEFLTQSDQRFTATDTDANGVLTPAERTAFRKQKREERAQARFGKADTNGDGQVSKDEYNAARALGKQRLKRRMDANGDGVLTGEDRQIRKVKRQERRAKRQKMRHKFRPDTNGDGVIDKAEFKTAANAIFARLDKNGDGMLDASEQRRPKKHHKKR